MNEQPTSISSSDARLFLRYVIAGIMVFYLGGNVACSLKKLSERNWSDYIQSTTEKLSIEKSAQGNSVAAAPIVTKLLTLEDRVQVLENHVQNRNNTSESQIIVTSSAPRVWLIGILILGHLAALGIVIWTAISLIREE